MYQARRVPFGKENYVDQRRTRAVEKVKDRRVSRQTGFFINRNIAPDLLSVSTDIKNAETKTVSRSEKLKKWKQEKEAFKKAEKAKEKPPFKCGAVHYKPPPVLGSECRRSERLKNNISNLSASAVKVAHVMPEILNRRKTVNKRQPIRINAPKKSFAPASRDFKESKQSFAPASHKFKAPDNLPKIKEEGTPPDVNATVQNADYSMIFPAQLSPWITKRKGSFGSRESESHSTCLVEKPVSVKKTPLKKSAELSKGTPDALRIILGKRLFEKSLTTPDVQEVKIKKLSPKCRTPILSEEDAACLQNFNSLYDGEMNRLDGVCSLWDNVLASDTCDGIPADMQDTIRTTVGQTRLLMREKLGQFKDLLKQFQAKTSKKSPVITSGDLQGFWDLVSIQVNDVDDKFRRLDQLKWNNWIACEEPKEAKVQPEVFRRRNVGSSNVKAKKPVAGKSSIKAYIAEQRRKLEEAKENAQLRMNENSPKSTNSPLLNLDSIATPKSLRSRSSVRLSARFLLPEQGVGVRSSPRLSGRK
ncbi:disks large-associated protein 5-like [Ischnura elegans]|uniref:disks large-associated protein 5-like n=1 Tax=Ischnura elegans TaxID=197161 RepID=UPI001ED86FEB|nr:disks large-associated protein 5-like [Ischnura elegans]